MGRGLKNWGGLDIMREMKYRVIVETDFRNRPKEHELSADKVGTEKSAG